MTHKRAAKPAPSAANTRIFGVVGWKNAGKTCLMERLVADITGRGFRVGTIKHAHHAFDVDHPGKPTHRLRRAGAQEVILAGPNLWVQMHEFRHAPEAPLADLLPHLAPCDLVLIEGYKREGHDKIETFRMETGQPLLAASDPSIKAVAANAPPGNIAQPVFDLDDTAAIAMFILAHVGLKNSP